MNMFEKYIERRSDPDFRVHAEEREEQDLRILIVGSIGVMILKKNVFQTYHTTYKNEKV